MELRNFRTGICKSLDAIERKVDARLTILEQKTDTIEKGQQDLKKEIAQTDLQLTEIGKKEKRLEKVFELLEDDFQCIEDELKGTQYITENIDNSL